MMIQMMMILVQVRAAAGGGTKLYNPCYEFEYPSCADDDFDSLAPAFSRNLTCMPCMVRVCEREGNRETERQRDRETERQRARERESGRAKERKRASLTLSISLALSLPSCHPPPPCDQPHTQLPQGASCAPNSCKWTILVEVEHCLVNHTVS
jgi:hypothetical protein